ncbi:protein HGH1 homolog [Halyomorpha halys]|uniref:protein HGH1 homolog n=1 Tax=Halyomorpha halys TaxID=286706 RepID=UPI0006D4FC8A|nr:protein HGH1 homolog [Halyomorpha halys]
MQTSKDEEPSIPMDSICLLLNSKSELAVKQTLEYILLNTTEVDNCCNIYNSPAVIEAIINLTDKFGHDEIGKIALNAIINITGYEEGAMAVYETKSKEKSILKFLKCVTDKNSKLAEHACKVLVNMTIPERLVFKVVRDFLSEKELFRLTFQAIHNKKYNIRGCSLSDYLSQVFGNLAQSPDFQKYLMTAEDGNLLCSILPVICGGETVLQRRGVTSTLYNCLLNSENHPLLLDKPFDILPYLLLPLAGPEEFDDKDVEKMPIELQYLEDSKVREKEPEIRKLLLESLLMLCATKHGRVYLRSKQTYLILREYHKWEKNSSILLACENVVDILIRTEDEIGIDDLKSVDVPNDLIEKFEKMDRDYLNS